MIIDPTLPYQHWFRGAIPLVYMYLLSAADADGLASVSVRGMAKDLGLTHQNVRTAISRMIANNYLIEVTQNLTHKVTQNLTHLKLCKLANYGTLPTQNLTHKVTQNLTQPKEPKIKVTKQEKQAQLDNRKSAFYNALVPYLHEYGKDMLREFFDYWSEPNKSGTKMRFELNSTWDLDRRLARWANNNKELINNGDKKTSRLQRDAAELMYEMLNPEPSC